MPDPDPLLTPDEVRSRWQQGAKPTSSAEYDDEWIAERVAAFEDTVLRYCGDEATVRTVTETIRPRVASQRLLLDWPKVTSITSVTVGETVLDSGDYKPRAGMVEKVGGCWTPGADHVVVYEHGFASLAGLKIACALYVQKCAGQDRSGSGRDQRSSGDVVYLVMPDWANDRPTGWTDVDATLNALRVRTPGVA